MAAYDQGVEKNSVIRTLRRNRGQLQRMGVRHVALFGSTARGDAGPESDLDLMVDIDPQAVLGVYEYVSVVQFLQSLFPGPVDVSNLEAQRPHVRETAARDAAYAF